MRTLIRIIKWMLIVLCLFYITLVISGKTYLIKALANTYLKGRPGPSINEFRIFDNRIVAANISQPWPLSSAYNEKQLSKAQRKVFDDFKTVAFVVVKNDSLLYEEYWDGISDTSHTNSFSMAKTIVSMLVGVAIHENKIKSLDQAVGDFIPKYSDGPNAKLTIKNLLTMSSGIDFDEAYNGHPFAYPAAAYYGNDLISLTLGFDVTEEPGKTWNYQSGNTQLLTMVLTKATGKSLSEYASEKLWKPIGANENAYWSLDHKNGIEKGYCCFNSNAKDFARLGALYLHNGSWKGQQLVPSDYVKESILPANLLDTEGKANSIYGYGWWLTNYQNHSVYYMRGIQGQYIFVIPDKNLVVVRLGHLRSNEKENDHPKDIFIYLNAALNM